MQVMGRGGRISLKMNFKSVLFMEVYSAGSLP